MSVLPHIFVVDDEPAAREMVGDYLKLHGFKGRAPLALVTFAFPGSPSAHFSRRLTLMRVSARAANRDLNPGRIFPVRGSRSSVESISGRGEGMEP